MLLRRLLLVSVAVLSLISLLVFVTDTDALANQEEREKLVELAKSEGEVMLYTDMPLPFQTEFVTAFEKKYPFLKVKIYRSGSANLLVRAQTEYRTGKYVPDVVSCSFWGVQWFFESNLLGVYNSPERDGIADFGKDKDGYWASNYLNLGVIAYNTRLVPPNKIPKSYQDFLDPWWKGRITLDDTGNWWYGLMLNIMGRDKGQSFMQKLAQQNITINRGQTLKVQLLAAGEFSAIINAYNTHIELIKRNGAPVEWVAPLDQPVIPNPHLIAIAKRPPHPNAAKLFIDFILSAEGQHILTRLNSIPSRLDVSPNPPRLMLGADGKKLKILSVDFELANRVDKGQEEFKKLFVRRRQGH